MARVQLVMPDEDRDRYVEQAQREGMSFSAWLRGAARERLEARQSATRFESSAQVREFFKTLEQLDGPETEPDWSEHLQVMSEAKSRGASRA